MIQFIRNLFSRKRLVGVCPYTITWLESGVVNKCTYLLYDHAIWGRSYKAVGFRFTFMIEETAMFCRIIAPWLDGAELPSNFAAHKWLVELSHTE